MIIRQVRAFATEIVQVTWTYDDGTTFECRYTPPPANVRKARCPNCGCEYETARDLRAWKDEK